ncbi:hypothetical protein scyTo_0013313 [Scyliorhinus torazame]|uniref:Uncharacterized protein n=1 Tax=Scyliorhinus torazame TaxID=75743 RepID=A0A401NTT7_SCYTO|nr:hypothetical protein [Scyliorhinus torazame]
MDSGLKPENLNLDARSPEAAEIFQYWLRCFEAYLKSSEIAVDGPRKLSLLHARVGHLRDRKGYYVRNSGRNLAEALR